MSPPLDAERPPTPTPATTAAAPSRTPSPDPRPRPSPQPRPTPFRRGSAEDHASSEVVENTPTAVEEHGEAEGTEELEPLEAGLAPAPEGVDVWELVSLAQGGDGDAFGRLYDHYVAMVHRYVYYRVGDRATAEDVTSETFVRALRRIDSLSFQGRDVGAWLVTIARNIVLDHVKSSRYRLEVTTADMRDADRATDGPENAVLANLTNQQLLACVQQLGSEQQECIVLRFLQGLSISETAQIMGKKENAIKALQHRAVRRLADLLPDGLR